MDCQKRLAFQHVFMGIILLKTIQNQHEQMTGQIVAIVEIRHFQDLKPYRPFMFSAHNHSDTQILSTVRFSS
jgi:hypothetical protein